ncbi:MAG: hypothetical protein KC933_21685 [Myxococcales bacterium]|nr:hypothetical protein [Myxococcales bacterium]
MIDATQTTRTPPQTTALPPPPAAKPEIAAQDDAAGYTDCVDRCGGENLFTAAFETSATEVAVKAGDSTDFTKVEGDAFRTDAKGIVMPPTHGDVDQGDLGDCWLMAGAAAVAHQDSEYIQGRISKNADGTFNVKLGDKTEVVTATFPNAGYADATPGSQKDTLWAALVEKAYAQQAGGYGKLDGGNSGTAMEKLTGKPSTTTSITASTKADDLYTTLKAGKDGDHPMTFDTKSSGSVSPLHDNHAYTVLDVYERDGQKYVKLYNPWGVNDGARDLSAMEHEMKIEDLVKSGAAVHVNGG